MYRMTNDCDKTDHLSSERAPHEDMTAAVRQYPSLDRHQDTLTDRQS
jgi:hypothetical protein